MRCRAVGAILNGYARDLKGILELNFPVFCYGSYAQDQAHAQGGRLPHPRSDREVTIAPAISSSRLRRSVCHPKNAEKEVFLAALEKARGEKHVRKEIEEGMPAKVAFEKYGSFDLVKRREKAYILIVYWYLRRMGKSSGDPKLDP